MTATKQSPGAAVPLTCSDAVELNASGVGMTAIFRKLGIATLALSPLLFVASAAVSRPHASIEGSLLAAHNSARAAVGAPPLAWDNGLQQQAAAYARYLASRNVFAHSSQRERGPTGENLWMGTQSAFTVRAMFAGWEAERAAFRPGIFPAVSRSGNWHDVGHYTQIVWPQTRRVGCAIASNRSFDFLVCRYWPAGNVHGMSVPAYRQVAVNNVRTAL